MTLWTTHDPGEVFAAAASLLAKPPWHADAACKEHPEVSWFPERGERSAPAKAICATCLVRYECLTAGLSEHGGIWGGVSDRAARSKLRRQTASTDGR